MTENADATDMVETKHGAGCSRVTATHLITRKRATSTWDFGLSPSANHERAARRLLGPGKLLYCSRTGGGYVFARWGER